MLYSIIFICYNEENIDDRIAHIQIKQNHNQHLREGIYSSVMIVIYINNL